MQFKIPRIFSGIDDHAVDELADHPERFGLVLVIGVAKPLPEIPYQGSIAFGCARVNLESRGFISNAGFQSLAPCLKLLETIDRRLNARLYNEIERSLDLPIELSELQFRPFRGLSGVGAKPLALQCVFANGLGDDLVVQQVALQGI